MRGVSGIYYFGQPDNKLNINYSVLNDKFSPDKTLFENEEFIIAIEGCVLNLKQLKNEYAISDVGSLLRLLWGKHNSNILKVLKGMYALIIYDKKKDKLFLSNDLLSKRSLYYYVDGDCIIFSSSFNKAITTIKKHAGKSLTLNKLAVSMMLIEGKMGGNITYAEEVKYLSRYEYIIIENNEVKQLKIKNNQDIVTKNMPRIIDELHERFSQAVLLQYEKNNEMGYKQVSTLSAGMDSRSCLLYALINGYKDILCITYAQSESIDYKIAQQITSDFQLEFLFYSLDSVRFLLKPNILIQRNECQQAFAGSTGASEIIDLLDTNNMGIIHTGLIGGELMSDVYSQNAIKAVTNMFLSQLPCADESVRNSYNEILKQYNTTADYLLDQNTRACQNFMRMVEHKCESCSPFLYEDFYTYVENIPVEFKGRRKLYREWMKKFIPNDYLTTYFKTSINASLLHELAKKVINRLVRYVYGKNKFDMNPLDYWDQSIPELQESLQKVLEYELNACINMSDEIHNSIKIVHNSGLDGSIKAITVVKAIQMLN